MMAAQLDRIASGARAIARAGALLVGAPAAALFLTAALTAAMPGAPEVRLLTAMLAVCPAMVAGACLVLRSRSTARAWVVCLVLSALALVYLHVAPGAGS